MGLEQRHALIEYPRVNLSKDSRDRARFLINMHYSNVLGPNIRNETVRSVRVKILEIEAHMESLRSSNPTIYRALARQCTDFERVCTLLEILS